MTGTLGSRIADELDIAREDAWVLDDCVVEKREFDNDLHAFDVYMYRECDGRIVVQSIIPADLDAQAEIVNRLDAGESPLGGWEDGMGEAVHPYNGEPVKIPSWGA